MFLRAVLLQICHTAVLYFSEVKIMVCFKFEVLLFILRKSQKNFFEKQMASLKE
jgi:hypothetical protein